MSLSNNIKIRIENNNKSKSKKTSEKELANQAEIFALTPMFKELKSELAEFGLAVIMHNDKNHLPSPAIHIKLGSMHFSNKAYDMISEIFISDKHWRAGSCNNHRYTLKNDKELLKHVEEAVSSLFS